MQCLEFRIRRRDGRVVWLEHVCRPVVDEQGRFLGTRVSNRDLTELKAAQEALQAAVAEIAKLKERLEKENLYLQDEIKQTRTTLKRSWARARRCGSRCTKSGSWPARGRAYCCWAKRGRARSCWPARFTTAAREAGGRWSKSTAPRCPPA